MKWWRAQKGNKQKIGSTAKVKLMISRKRGCVSFLKKRHVKEAFEQMLCRKIDCLLILFSWVSTLPFNDKEPGISLWASMCHKRSWQQIWWHTHFNPWRRDREGSEGHVSYSIENVSRDSIPNSHSWNAEQTVCNQVEIVLKVEITSHGIQEVNCNSWAAWNRVRLPFKFASRLWVEVYENGDYFFSFARINLQLSDNNDREWGEMKSANQWLAIYIEYIYWTHPKTSDTRKACCVFDSSCFLNKWRCDCSHDTIEVLALTRRDTWLVLGNPLTIEPFPFYMRMFKDSFRSFDVDFVRAWRRKSSTHRGCKDWIDLLLFIGYFLPVSVFFRHYFLLGRWSIWTISGNAPNDSPSSLQSSLTSLEVTQHKDAKVTRCQ